jgi:hypothetical protein
MKAIVGTAMLTLVAAVAAAQTPATKAAMPATEKAAVEKTLIANEQKVNDAVMKGDVTTFKSVVADDAWSIDEGMGLAPVNQFEAMLKPGTAKITDMKLSDFKVLWVDANTAVLTYTWTGKGTMMDQPVKSPIVASTVYANRGGKWVAVFHQETAKASMSMSMPMKK